MTARLLFARLAQQDGVGMAIETPLLITSAINPPDGMPFLKMKAPAPRLAGVRFSALFAASQGVRRLVVADATMSRPLSDSDISLLAQMGCEVEQVCYAQDGAAAIERGKGYAEGNLIAFAVDESELIRREGRFFKITSKLICRNLGALQASINRGGVETILWRDVMDGSLPGRRIDVRFYLTTTAFAKETLLPAYLAADDRTKAVETAIYEAAQQTLVGATGVRPLLTGFSGGTGGPYFDGSLGHLDANFPCWLLSPQARRP